MTGKDDSPSPLQRSPSSAYLWGDWAWRNDTNPAPLGRLALDAEGHLRVTVDGSHSGTLEPGQAFDLALAILELRQERVERLTAADLAAMARTGFCAIDGKKLDRRPARQPGHFEWVCPCGLTVSE